MIVRHLHEFKQPATCRWCNKKAFYQEFQGMKLVGACTEHKVELKPLTRSRDAEFVAKYYMG